MDDVSQRPTVFIVDDDEGGRDSLSYRWVVIKSIGIDVEAYGSPIDFLDSFDGSRPGCLVLDVRMPQMGGLDLLKAVRERGIDTPAIMISAFGDVPMAINAMKNGAVDFLTKPFNDQELLDRIQQGIDDDFHQRKLGSEITEIRVRFEKLTTREREVLARLMEGKQNKQIAHEMEISPKTVEAHRAKLMEKTRAESLVNLLRMVATLEQPALQL